MKTIKSKKKSAKLIKGFTYNSELDGKYDNDPMFKEKAVRAKEILNKAGIPKF